MQPFNQQVLDSNTGAASGNIITGNWANISYLGSSISLNITGLEADGAVAVFLSNSQAQPTLGTTEPSAVQVQSIAGISGGKPQFVNITAHAAWLLLVKTKGVSPAHTTVRLYGNQ